MPRKAPKHRPWRHGGTTLGFIRSGTYYIDRTVHKKRHKFSTGCRTAEAALDEYRRWEKDPTHHIPRGAAGAPWDQAVKDFIAYSARVLRNTPRHVEHQAAHLANFGDLKRGGIAVFSSLDGFAGRDVRQFMAALSEGVVTGNAVGRPTLNRHLASLRALMRWARLERRTGNAGDLEVPFLREERGVNPPSEVPESRWRPVLAHLLERWRLACEVMLGAGLRYSEVAKLAPGDVRPGAIDVRHAKSRRARTVPASARTILAASRLIELGGVPDDTASQLDHRIAVAALKVKVDRFTAHELRHTYASVCLRNRVSVGELQARLGHASLATTQRYVHASEAQVPAGDSVGAPL